MRRFSSQSGRAWDTARKHSGAETIAHILVRPARPSGSWNPKSPAMPSSWHRASVQRLRPSVGKS
eukprot:1563050-Pyramimonas_sp.AAC.1